MSANGVNLTAPLKGATEAVQKPVNSVIAMATNSQFHPELFWILAKIIGIVVALIVLGLALTYAFDPELMVKKTDVDLIAKKRQSELEKFTNISGVEGFQDLNANNSFYKSLINQLDERERYLVNLCPLTASLGGYIGPTEMGVFTPDWYLRKALRAGIRSFVLPISTYTDDNKKPPSWPFSGKPAIVCRNNDGKIISLNGLSIQKFCENLKIFRSENTVQADEPIFVVIKQVEGFIPDKVRAEKNYVKLTSDIAKELQALDPFRLTTIGAYGSAVGAQRESEIMMQVPVTELKNKILVMTDFDFRVGLKDQYNSIRPRLYDYVNFGMKPIVAENAGLQSGGFVKEIRLEDISGSKINWTDQARANWLSATLNHPLELPSTAVVDNAVKMGVQMIPVPFYAVDTTGTKPVWDLWGGFAWRLKQPGARYAKPKPVEPATPSAKLNARVDNSLQPGQTKIM